MGVVFNTKKGRVDKNGVVQRQKFQGALPVSLAYGLYLGDFVPDEDEGGSPKAFFLMNSWVAANGAIVTPGELRSNPLYAKTTLDEFPFSKKFTISDDSVLEALVPGTEYWFLYTSEAVCKPINGKMVTYEALELICVADIPGADGIKTLLPILKVHFKPQNPS